MDDLNRVLQVNLEDSGGAFSIMFQVQRELKKKLIFDYYSMGGFSNQRIIDEIEELGGIIKEANLRKNRLIGHILLPFEFYNFLRNNPYNIVHIHSDTAWKLLLYAFPAQKARVKKIIVHSHSSDINGDYRWLKFFCHICAKPFLSGFATNFLSCSDMASKWMFPQKLSKRIVKIHNGVDTERFRFNKALRDNKRRELGVKEEEVLIGTVGDFSYPKNPLLMVKIVEHLNKKKHRYKAVFVGHGKDKKKVKDYVKRFGMNDDVIFYGNSFKMKDLYSAMDVYVMTSRFEGLPVSAVEAQANGLKTILSDRISKDTKILDDCQFAELWNIDDWCGIITQFCDFATENEKERYNAYITVSENGFDIMNTSKEILHIYDN